MYFNFLIFMLLVFDVGNTNISVAVCNGDKIIHKWRIVTSNIENYEDLNIIMSELFKMEHIELSIISNAIMSSVVLGIDEIISEFCFKKNIKLMKLCDNNLNINFDSVVPNWKGYIGEDIICNIVAGKKKFKENFIIIDMGTAITFDIAGKNGLHIGEVIVPDINIALKSMTKNCSLLGNESNKFKYQDFVIGRNTEEAINGGLFFGYIGLIRNIVEKIKEEYGKEMKACLTGGISNIFLHHLNFVNEVDKNLTIKGLIEIWKDNV